MILVREEAAWRVGNLICKSLIIIRFIILWQDMEIPDCWINSWLLNTNRCFNIIIWILLTFLELIEEYKLSSIGFDITNLTLSTKLLSGQQAIHWWIYYCKNSLIRKVIMHLYLALKILLWNCTWFFEIMTSLNQGKVD